MPQGSGQGGHGVTGPVTRVGGEGVEIEIEGGRLGGGGAFWAMKFGSNEFFLFVCMHRILRLP